MTEITLNSIAELLLSPFYAASAATVARDGQEVITHTQFHTALHCTISLASDWTLACNKPARSSGRDPAYSAQVHPRDQRFGQCGGPKGSVHVNQDPMGV